MNDSAIAGEGSDRAHNLETELQEQRAAAHLPEGEHQDRLHPWPVLGGLEQRGQDCHQDIDAEPGCEQLEERSRAAVQEECQLGCVQ